MLERIEEYTNSLCERHLKKNNGIRIGVSTLEYLLKRRKSPIQTLEIETMRYFGKSGKRPVSNSTLVFFLFVSIGKVALEPQATHTAGA